MVHPLESAHVHHRTYLVRSQIERIPQLHCPYPYPSLTFGPSGHTRQIVSFEQIHHQDLDLTRSYEFPEQYIQRQVMPE